MIKVDIDKNQQAAQQYNIQGVPTLILFKEGKILWRQSGALSAHQIDQAVKSHHLKKFKFAPHLIFKR